MPFNQCPVCKRRAKVKLLGYKAVCEWCNIDLSEAPAMKATQLGSVIVGFIFVVLAQRRGTDGIVAQYPDDAVWPLFLYYFSVFLAISLVVGLANYIIRNYFAVYEPPKNT